MADKKPHILLLIDDQHRGDVMPIEGNPHIRTPTLDRLISEGTYFRNAYTPSPICVPARPSFMSGRYPRNAGCLTGADPIPDELVTIPGYLSQYGYRPVCAGKMHFTGTDPMRGWQERIGRDIVAGRTAILRTLPRCHASLEQERRRMRRCVSTK